MGKSSKGSVKHNLVVANSIVDVIDLMSGIKYRYKIVSMLNDSLMFEEVTIESPIGEALLGKKVGDNVLIVSGTRYMELKIMDIFN